MTAIEELLTIRAVGERLGVSRQRAQQLVREKGFPEPGEIVVIYKGWDPRAVDEWAKANRPPAPPADADDIPEPELVSVPSGRPYPPKPTT